MNDKMIDEKTIPPDVPQDVPQDKDDSLKTAALRYRPTETDPDSRFADRNRRFQGIPAVERTPSGRLFFAF